LLTLWQTTSTGAKSMQIKDRVATGHDNYGEGKTIVQGRGKVREFYFKTGKIDILKKSQATLR